MTKLTRKLWIALMHPLTAFFSAKLDSSLERAAPATKLAAELAGPDPDRRKLAAAQLSSLGLLALPALVAASRSKSLPARAHAVLLLGRIGSKSVLARRALHRIRERDPDRRIRWLARLSTGSPRPGDRARRRTSKASATQTPTGPRSGPGERPVEDPSFTVITPGPFRAVREAVFSAAGPDEGHEARLDGALKNLPPAIGGEEHRKVTTLARELAAGGVRGELSEEDHWLTAARTARGLMALAQVGQPRSLSPARFQASESAASRSSKLSNPRTDRSGRRRFAQSPRTRSLDGRGLEPARGCQRTRVEGPRLFGCPSETRVGLLSVAHRRNGPSR
jgi:hypothetical protein